jgi:hypothetical protein
MKHPTVLLDRAPPDDGEEYVDVPMGNDRWFAVTLFNRRRGADRARTGTVTVWRLRALFEAIGRRYPQATKTPPHIEPMKVRTKRGGPVVMICEALEGPSESVAARH